MAPQITRSRAGRFVRSPFPTTLPQSQIDRAFSPAPSASLPGVHNPDAATILRRSLHEFNGVVRKTMGGGVYFGRTFRDLFEGGRAFSDDMSVMRGGAESQSQESQEAFFPPQLVLNHQSSLTSATSSTASSMVDGSHGDGMAVGLFTSKRKFTMEEEIEGMCLGGEEVGGGKRHKTGGGLF